MARFFGPSKSDELLQSISDQLLVVVTKVEALSIRMSVVEHQLAGLCQHFHIPPPTLQPANGSSIGADTSFSPADTVADPVDLLRSSENSADSTVNQTETKAAIRKPSHTSSRFLGSRNSDTTTASTFSWHFDNRHSSAGTTSAAYNTPAFQTPNAWAVVLGNFSPEEKEPRLLVDALVGACQRRLTQRDPPIQCTLVGPTTTIVPYHTTASLDTLSDSVRAIVVFVSWNEHRGPSAQLINDFFGKFQASVTKKRFVVFLKHGQAFSAPVQVEGSTEKELQSQGCFTFKHQHGVLLESIESGFGTSVEQLVNALAAVMNM